MSVYVSLHVWGEKFTLLWLQGSTLEHPFSFYRNIRTRNNLFSSLMPDQDHHRFTACIKGLDFQLKEHFGNPVWPEVSHKAILELGIQREEKLAMAAIS